MFSSKGLFSYDFESQEHLGILFFMLIFISQAATETFGIPGIRLARALHQA